MVSKFILNIFSKGSIHLEEGRLYLWNNPFLFIPLSSFAIFEKGLIDIYGEEGKKLLYWLGKIQGKNSTQMIIERFGYSPSDENFKYFIDGSTMVGMGTIRLKEYNMEKRTCIILCDDSTFAKVFYEKFKKSKYPVDFYMSGILAGGTEPLVNYNVLCSESECIAQNNKQCVYNLKFTEDIEIPNSAREISKKLGLLLTNSKNLFVKRKGVVGTIFSKQIVFFSNGALLIDNVKGLILPTYLFSILSYLLLKKDKSLYNNLLESVSIDYIENLKFNFKKGNISYTEFDKNLCLLDKFGLGKFKLIKSEKKEWLIENKTTPYPEDFKFLFGKQKESIDQLSKFIIKSLIKKTLSNNFEIEEIKCIAKGDSSCLFRIRFL